MTEPFVNCSSRYYKDCDIIKADYSPRKKRDCAEYHRTCEPDAYDWMSEMQNWAKVETKDRTYIRQSKEQEETWRELMRAFHKDLPPPLPRPEDLPDLDEQESEDDEDIPVFFIMLIVFGSIIGISGCVAFVIFASKNWDKWFPNE